MKTKVLLSVFLLGITCAYVSGQQYAIDKGAKFISGTITYENQGGDLYLYPGDKRISTFTLTPSFNGFIAKNIYLGGGMAFTRTSQGSVNVNDLQIGPVIGIAAGDSTSTAFPYFDISLRYCTGSINTDISMDHTKDSGTNFVLSGGLIVQLRPHCGFVFEVGYNMLKMKPEGSKTYTKGNIFTVGIGLVGLLY